MHAPHLVADVFGALASVVFGQAVFAVAHVASFDFDNEQLPARRDDDDVVFAKALLIALHARPRQVVEHVKSIGQAVFQCAQNVALAVAAQVGRGVQWEAGVNSGHGQLLP